MKKLILLVAVSCCLSTFLSCNKAELTTEPSKSIQAVDLGLSVKWASCNIGASNPEAFGNYFAWGEIATKSKYSQDNSTTFGESLSDISGNAQYDAARVQWGEGWRIPTAAEVDELITQCKWEWVGEVEEKVEEKVEKAEGKKEDLNFLQRIPNLFRKLWKGIFSENKENNNDDDKVKQENNRGYKVTGPNGNSIFLPAAGYRQSSPYVLYTNAYGGYHSSTPNPENTEMAYFLRLYPGNVGVDSTLARKDTVSGVWNNRDFGRCIRPVTN